MQPLLNLFADQFFLMDLAISATGLSFMCALTYAMRWLPGKASESQNLTKNIQNVAVDPETAEMNFPSIEPSPLTAKTEKECNAMAAVD